MQRLGFYGGLFLVTTATLMLQLIQTRIFSVVSWYHLAFFVISIAMFGLTAGAVWVYLQGERFSTATLSHDLAHFTGAFAVATVVALAVQLTVSPVTELTLVSVLLWAELAICLSVPFFFAGVVVSLALTRSPYPIGMVYGIDLCGAALGCIGALLLLEAVDGSTAVLWVAVLSALAALLFARSGIGSAPAKPWPLGGILRRPAVICLVLAIGALANGLVTPRGLNPLFIKGAVESPGERIFEKWNSFSRIVMSEAGIGAPRMWGASPKFNWDDWQIDRRDLTIDGLAGTTTYRTEDGIESLEFLRYDVTNLAYVLPGRERAAVLGVGGGRDILSARVFGVRSIVGVELNPILHRLLMTEPGFADFSRINKMPGITIEVDEARSWLARSTERFDLIQLSMVDTWAATGAGAFSLSENGLYTVEAWRIFLNRLGADGVFTVSRWYAPERIDETGRVVSLATATAFDLGIADPRRHIFLAAAGNVANLILSRAPMTPATVRTLEDAADDLGFSILVTPRREPDVSVLRDIVTSRNRMELEHRTAQFALDLRPPVDERPFFFNQLPLHQPLQAMALALEADNGGVVSGNLFATATLLILLLVSAVLVIATIVIPLRPAARDIGRRLAWGGTAYFGLIGVGFMCVEIGLLQRMSVFLGHPIYSLSVVLFSLILATGIGSLISDRLPLDTDAKVIVWALATGGYVFALPWWLSSFLLGYESADLVQRAAVCVLVMAPAGLLMGYGFPTGMRLISRVNRGPTPWFWGINGAAGVLAASLAVACSLAFGIATALMVGAVCYVLLIPPAMIIARAEAAPVNR